MFVAIRIRAANRLGMYCHMLAVREVIGRYPACPSEVRDVTPILRPIIHHRPGINRLAGLVVDPRVETPRSHVRTGVREPDQPYPSHVVPDGVLGVLAIYPERTGLVTRANLLPFRALN